MRLRESEQVVLGWITKLLAKVSLPFKPGEELNPGAIALPSSKGRVHDVEFNFGFWYGEWGKIAELSAWTIYLDWTLISELNSFRNKAYETWRRRHWQEDETPFELDKQQSRVFSFLEKFEFVISALGFYIQPDYEDVIDKDHWRTFDYQIIKARKIVQEKQPGYQPLYLVRSERIFMQEDGGQVTFRSTESYRIFSELMGLLLKDPLLPLDQFVELPEFQESFQYDAILQNRARRYIEAYKQNPESPGVNFEEKDLAYPIAEELDKQYWDEIDKEIKKEKI